jgi:NitT/TauT family transport system substrate-binding protein
MKKLAGMLLGLAVLCVPNPAGADEVVRVGALKAVHYSALWYLPEMGPKYGLKFEVIEFKKGLDAMEAMKTGAIDIASSAADGAIAARASGVPLYIVSGFSRGGIMIVGRSDLALKSVAELKGKKVGVVRGGAQELALLMELAKAGLTSADEGDKDVQLIYLSSYPSLNEALATRNVDAICQIEPQAAIAVAKGFGRELLKPYGSELGMPVKVVTMTAKFHDERRGAAAKVMQAFVEATKLFLEKPDVPKKFYSEVVFKGNLTPQEYDAAVANSPFSVDVTVEHVQQTIDAMLKYGVGRMSTPPAAKDFVRLDLLSAAKKALEMK